MIEYTGIGSRETPPDVLFLFEYLGEFFARNGFCLRSGHANGADQAFERGCDKVGGPKHIFLPWKGFEGSKSCFTAPIYEAYKVAEKFHPGWKNVSDGARPLHARNSHQVLGWNLHNPADFIICWTKNGKGAGGTGQALRIANHYNIPVFDAGKYTGLEHMKEQLKLFLVDNAHFKLEDLTDLLK